MPASTRVRIAFRVCVISRMVRLGIRSAMAPVCRPNRSIGRNCSAMVTPTAVELWVRVKISQSCAMLCIHEPVLASA
jgi:hypothetical protein